MSLGGQRHSPVALPLGKTRYPLYRMLGGPQGRSGQLRKILPPPGFDPHTVQPCNDQVQKTIRGHIRPCDPRSPDFQDMPQNNCYSEDASVFKSATHVQHIKTVSAISRPISAPRRS